MLKQHSDVLIKEIGSGEFETMFGFKICTRHNEDDELEQMIKFARYISAIGLAKHISELFYDSNCDVCFISTRNIDTLECEESCYVRDAIKFVAALTISQYELFDIIGHKNWYLANKFKLVI